MTPAVIPTISVRSSEMGTKQKSGISPILNLILSGGSSRVLDLIDLAKTNELGLFRMPAMNRTVIFKCPMGDENGKRSVLNQNSSIKESGEKVEVSVDEKMHQILERPVETGIYIPLDIRNFVMGGFGIYLRQKNYRELMLEHIGLNESTSRVADNLDYDFRMLKVLDNLPTLDPFLLSVELKRFDQRFHNFKFAISEDEVKAIKLVVERRLAPIIDRAMNYCVDRAAESRSRFMEAVWKPECPEAEMFVKAFRIGSENAAGIFDALKGISYYEHLMASIRPSWLRLFEWLRDEESKPADWRACTQLQAPITMFKASLSESVRDTVDLALSVFRNYAHALKLMLDDGNPNEFRSFLLQADASYWKLGLCISTLSNGGIIHSKILKEQPQVFSKCDETYEYLRKLHSIFDAATNALKRNSET